MAHYKLILKSYTGNVNNGFVSKIEFGGSACGVITDEWGNELGRHGSSTLAWLERDLLGKVKFNPNVDSYEKNW